jgi:hypothetical protein
VRLWGALSQCTRRRSTAHRAVATPRPCRGRMPQSSLEGVHGWPPLRRPGCGPLARIQIRHSGVRWEGNRWRRERDSNLGGLEASRPSESGRLRFKAAHGSPGGSLPWCPNSARSLFARLLVTGTSGVPALLIPLQETSVGKSLRRVPLAEREGFEPARPRSLAAVGVRPLAFQGRPRFPGRVPPLVP